MKNFKLNTYAVAGLLALSGIIHGQSGPRMHTVAGSYYSEPQVSALGSEIKHAGGSAASSVIKAGMEAKKLDGNVNSQYCEIGPLLSEDGKILYFSRYMDPSNVGGKDDEEDIWYAEWDSERNTWGPAKNMGSPLNNKYPNFINSITPNGNAMVLGNAYLPGGEMIPGLSISYHTSEGWSKPEEIIIEGCRGAEWSGAYLGPDQKVLILSQNIRKHSYGDLDLYVSFHKKDNIWSKPVNLGPVINSAGIESAPFLSSDERTLYYTTDGQGGYGGSDIFMSQRLDDTWQNWSQPVNMGPKVNTGSDESFFSMSADASRIYFTSERDMPGNHDIYMLAEPTAEKPAVVKSINKMAWVTAPVTIPVKDISIRAIYFDFDKTDLSAEAMAELNKLAAYINHKSRLIIELSSYTDNSGSTQYNTELSRKRADKVVAYLKERCWIGDGSIIIKAYGEANPVTDNITAEDRSLNRRIEFKIIPGVIKN